MVDLRKTKVAVYCRVATGDQIALNAQVERMKCFVVVHPDWQLTNTYIDTCAAAPLSKRTGLAKLIHDAKDGQFTMVAIPKPSRLARSLSNCCQLLAAMEEAGLSVIFADGEQAGDFHQLIGCLPSVGE